MTFSLLGSFLLQLKTLLLLLGETFRRAKVMNFSFSRESFARRIVSPGKVSPDKVSLDNVSILFVRHGNLSIQHWFIYRKEVFARFFRSLQLLNSV